ncbi:ABC transporter permease, partial [Mycobacteroides abscessus subsp. massiliense]|nr:ABC transporter permease [Mycobacteroides abscessus subsp. massiliense]
MTTRNTLVAAAATDSDAPVSSPSRREWVFERRWEIVRFLSPLAVLLIWQAGSAWGL